MLRKELGEVASIFNGKTPSKADQRSSGFPVLKIRDVDSTGTFRGPYASFVERSFAEAFADKILREGDTLILNAAHNADYVGSKVFFVTPGAAGALATGEWLIIRPDGRQVDSRFIFFWSQSPGVSRRVQQLVRGIHLYPKDVADIPITLPSRPEQLRIAEALGQADKVRRLQRHSAALADGFLGQTFLSMFGDIDKPRKGVRISKLGEHLSFVTSGSRGWAKYYSTTGSRFIRSLDVRMNHVSDEDAVYVTPPSGAEAERTRVRPGDVLLTITGSQIGRVAPVPQALAGAYVSQHVAILRLNGILDPVFLAMFLSLDAGGQREIERAQYGQTKPGLNLDQIREFRVPIPSSERQALFVDLATRHAKLRRCQDETMRQAEHLFGSLVHRAFAA